MFAKRTPYSLVLALALLLGLLLTACERPAQETGDETAGGDLFPTATTAVVDSVAPGADADDGAAYPPPDETRDGDEYPPPVDEGENGDEAPRPDDEGDGTGDAADGDGTGAAEEGGDSADDADAGDDAADAETGDEGASDEDADGEDSAEAGDDDAGDDADSDGDDAAADDDGDDADADDSGDADGGDAGDAGDDESADDGDGAEATLPQVHVVQPGETLYRVGLLYNVSWVVLAAENNLPYPYIIYVGQELRLPGSGEEPTEPDEEAEVFHTVRFGETLFSIGQRYGVSYLQIAEANGILNPNNILAGQVLKIPTDAPGPNQEFSHTVLPGQTLSQIAALYGVSLGSIAERNALRAPYLIFAGQTLIIPGD